MLGAYWEPTLWVPTVSGYGSRIWTAALTSLGAYTLGAYILGQRISDLDGLSPVLKKKYGGPFNVNVL